MLKNSKSVTIMCGFALAIATVILYFIALDNIFTVKIRWISLAMLIIAEAIETAKVFAVRGSVFSVATIITSLVHVASVLAVTIVFMVLLPRKILTYILINILLMCFILIIDVITAFCIGSKLEKEMKRKENQKEQTEI